MATVRQLLCRQALCLCTQSSILHFHNSIKVSTSAHVARTPSPREAECLTQQHAPARSRLREQQPVSLPRYQGGRRTLRPQHSDTQQQVYSVYPQCQLQVTRNISKQTRRKLIVTILHLNSLMLILQWEKTGQAKIMIIVTEEILMCLRRTQCFPAMYIPSPFNPITLFSR